MPEGQDTRRLPAQAHPSHFPGAQNGRLCLWVPLPSTVVLPSERQLLDAMPQLAVNMRLS